MRRNLSMRILSRTMNRRKILLLSLSLTTTIIMTLYYSNDRSSDSSLSTVPQRLPQIDPNVSSCAAIFDGDIDSFERELHSQQTGILSRFTDIGILNYKMFIYLHRDTIHFWYRIPEPYNNFFCNFY